MSAQALGAASLAATARQAADELRSLDLEGVGDLLLSEVDPPVRTGLLQESLYVRTADSEVILATDLRYAPYANARHPFITPDVLAAQEASIVDLVFDELTDAVGVIQGA